jgi:hypothetical protein
VIPIILVAASILLAIIPTGFTPLKFVKGDNTQGGTQ